MSNIIMGLCAGRHSITEAKDYIFGSDENYNHDRVVTAAVNAAIKLGIYNIHVYVNGVKTVYVDGERQ